MENLPVSLINNSMDKKDWAKNFRKKDVEFWVQGGIKLLEPNKKGSPKPKQKPKASSPESVRHLTKIPDKLSSTSTRMRPSNGNLCSTQLISSKKSQIDFITRSENHIKPYSGRVSPSAIFKPLHDSTMAINTSVYKVAEQAITNSTFGKTVGNSNKSVAKLESTIKGYFSPQGTRTSLNAFSNSKGLKKDNFVFKPKTTSASKRGLELPRSVLKLKDEKGR